MKKILLLLIAFYSYSMAGCNKATSSEIYNEMNNPAFDFHCKVVSTGITNSYYTNGLICTTYSIYKHYYYGGIKYECRQGSESTGTYTLSRGLNDKCTGKDVVFNDNKFYSCDANTGELTLIENALSYYNEELICKDGYSPSNIVHMTVGDSNAVNWNEQDCVEELSNTTTPEGNGDSSTDDTTTNSNDTSTDTNTDTTNDNTDTTDSNTDTSDSTDTGTDTSTDSSGSTDSTDTNTDDTNDTTDNTDNSSDNSSDNTSSSDGSSSTNIFTPTDSQIPDEQTEEPTNPVNNNCDDSGLTLTEKMLCEMNKGINNSDGTDGKSGVAKLLNDLKKSNRDADTAMNENLINISKLSKEIRDSNTQRNTNLSSMDTGIKSVDNKISQSNNFLDSISNGMDTITSFLGTVTDLISNPSKIGDKISGKLSEVANKYTQKFVNDSSCAAIQTISISYHGQQVTFLSQALLDNYFPIEIMRAIIILTFAISGFMNFFRGAN